MTEDSDESSGTGVAQLMQAADSYWEHCEVWQLLRLLLAVRHGLRTRRGDLKRFKELRRRRRGHAPPVGPVSPWPWPARTSLGIDHWLSKAHWRASGRFPHVRSEKGSGLSSGCRKHDFVMIFYDYMILYDIYI